jgi:phage FluMu protein gp41
MPATVTIPLTTPIIIGKQECGEVILREAGGGDVIEAQEESEKLIMTVDGPQLVASPTLVGVNVLRRQVVSIGPIKGPVDIVTLKRLSVPDLNAVQRTADDMDKAQALQIFKAELNKRGRDGEHGSDDSEVGPAHGEDDDVVRS